MVNYYVFSKIYDGVVDRLIINVKFVDPNTGNESKIYKGLIDTGATVSGISENVVKEMNLIPVGSGEIYGSTGTKSKNMYVLKVKLQESVIFDNIPIFELDIQNQGLDVIIGMDILCIGDFAMTKKDGKTIISFTIPSRFTVDFREAAKLAAKSEPNSKVTHLQGMQ